MLNAVRPSCLDNKVVSNLERLFSSQIDANILSVAAGEELQIFEALNGNPLSFSRIQEIFDISEEATAILVGSLAAQGLLQVDSESIVSITPFGKEVMVKGQPFCVAEYFALSGITPDVKELETALKSGEFNSSRTLNIASHLYRASIVSKNFPPEDVSVPAKRGLSTSLNYPTYDATPLFDLFRIKHLPDILVVAVKYYDFFTYLSATGPIAFDTLKNEKQLEDRAAIVMLTALCSLGLIDVDLAGNISLSENVDTDTKNALQNLRTFDSKGIEDTYHCLSNNRPVGETVYVAGESTDSPMDDPQIAGILTEALRGRACHVAPYLVDAVNLSFANHIVDIGGGSGIYGLSFLLKHPHLKLTIVDRQAVLDVAAKYVEELGLQDRVTLLAGDMKTMDLPEADSIIVSNVIHDIDKPEAFSFTKRLAGCLNEGGRLLIHDAMLDPTTGQAIPIATGSCEIAAYSWALFSITEGRAYSITEFREMLEQAGLRVGALQGTAIQCSVLEGIKVPD